MATLKHAPFFKRHFWGLLASSNVLRTYAYRRNAWTKPLKRFCNCSKLLIMWFCCSSLEYYYYVERAFFSYFLLVSFLTKLWKKLWFLPFRMSLRITPISRINSNVFRTLVFEVRTVSFISINSKTVQLKIDCKIFFLKKKMYKTLIKLLRRWCSFSNLKLVFEIVSLVAWKLFSVANNYDNFWKFSTDSQGLTLEIIFLFAELPIDLKISSHLLSLWFTHKITGKFLTSTSCLLFWKSVNMIFPIRSKMQ